MRLPDAAIRPNPAVAGRTRDLATVPPPDLSWPDTEGRKRWWEPYCDLLKASAEWLRALAPALMAVGAVITALTGLAALVIEALG
jgi:hypothetical protein